MSLAHRPKLGQHFLHDQRFRQRILNALALEAGDVVLEIGPGRGAMTRLLAERARKVIAIEVDAELTHRLQKDFQQQPRVEIIRADVLGVDFTELCRSEGIAQAFAFGNLPYYITSPILHHLLAHRRSIGAMGLLMQREVAERVTAAPGSRDYGYLSVAAQLYSQPRVALAVPPGAFSPAPKVQSALVTFRMEARIKGWPDERLDQFLVFAKRCFGQKRKALVNNLTPFYPRGRVIEVLEQAGKSTQLRAEQLSVEELALTFEGLRAYRLDAEG